jgi:hypothetical protein
LFTDEPINWPNPPPTTVLHSLLVFVGIPLLITAVIVLLVMLPSLAKASRGSRGESWEARSEWFGSSDPRGVLEGAPGDAREQRQLTGSTRTPAPEDETGGASVRW